MSVMVAVATPALATFSVAAAIWFSCVVVCSTPCACAWIVILRIVSSEMAIAKYRVSCYVAAFTYRDRGSNMRYLAIMLVLLCMPVLAPAATKMQWDYVETVESILLRNGFDARISPQDHLAGEKKSNNDTLLIMGKGMGRAMVFQLISGGKVLQGAKNKGFKNVEFLDLLRGG